MPTSPPKHRPPYASAPNEARRAHDRTRGSASARGYDRTWRKLRLMVLAEEPLCRFCREAGKTVGAEEVDHIIPVEERPDLRLDRNNLRGLCSPCHARRTADYLRGRRY